MSNNFTTLSTNPVTEKFLLVRLNPCRAIQDDLTLDSGTTYTATFAFNNIPKIEVNGTEYTLVTTTPSANEFSFSETTKLITINLGAALTTQYVVASYYLFYTNDKHRVTYETPDDNSTTKRLWEPKLLGSPSFKVSQGDIIDGFFSIGNTSLEIDNLDADFQQYCGDNDSFYKNTVQIWQGLNTTENIQKLFIGKVASLNVNKKVSLNIDNIFGVLNQTYFSNGTLLKSTFNTTTYPSVSPFDINKPVYKIISQVSPFIFIRDDYFRINQTALTTYDSNQDHTPLQNLLEARNTNHNSNSSTTVNRIWSAGVASIAASSYTTPLVSLDVNYTTFFDVSVADTQYFKARSKITIGVGKYVVTGILSATQLRISDLNSAATHTPVAAETVTRQDIDYVLIEDTELVSSNNIRYYELPYEEFSVDTDSNGVRRITLKDNFEASYSARAGAPLLSDAKVYFRQWNADSDQHGTVIKTILEDSGLTVNSASITTANLTDIPLSMTIPIIKQDTFLSYREYLQMILKSSLGILNVNSSFELVYSLLSLPTSNTNITNTEIMRNSFSQDINYNDIISGISYTNNHGYISGHSSFSDYDDTALDTINTNTNTSNKATYLHGIKKLKEIEHVLHDTTNVFSRLVALLENRRVTYSFKTKGINFSSNVGDNLTIKNDQIIGNSTSKNVIIVETDRQSNETTIKTNDLLGL